MNESFPLVDFVSEMAARPGATDITLCSNGRVGLRQKTKLAVFAAEPLRGLWRETVESCFPDRPPDHRQAFTRMLVGTNGRRLRATLSCDHDGESIALRVLPDRIQDPAELLVPEGLECFFLGLRKGLFLVAGPTGAGKSTTVASLLRSRALNRGGKIVSIEDPVEIPQEGTDRCIILQRELGTSVLSYEQGLGEAMLMNPDVISVQELRDRRAAEAALSAALSGHLVLASIQAFGAVSAIQRLITLLGASLDDPGLRDSLSFCLEAVVFQRLVPGFERLVPLFEIMTFRGKEGRLHGMERLLRLGNWTGLEQELESGSRHGMLTCAESLRRRIDEGLISAETQGGAHV
jgi:twitching motility protein PilT